MLAASCPPACPPAPGLHQPLPDLLQEGPQAAGPDDQGQVREDGPPQVSEQAGRLHAGCGQLQQAAGSGGSRRQGWR